MMYWHSYLREWQLLRIGATLADTLFHDAHGKPLMGHTLGSLASVTVVGRQMRMHAMQQQLKAFGGIAQAAQRKPTTGQWSAGQGPAKRFRT